MHHLTLRLQVQVQNNHQWRIHDYGHPYDHCLYPRLAKDGHTARCLHDAIPVRVPADAWHILLGLPWIGCLR